MYNHLPPPDPKTIHIETTDDPWSNLHAAATRLYPLQDDVEALRAAAKPDASDLAEVFTRLRRHYPVRRAWHIPQICFSPSHAEAAQLAEVIGMRLE
jgi:hypothetical protein